MKSLVVLCLIAISCSNEGELVVCHDSMRISLGGWSIATCGGVVSSAAEGTNFNITISQTLSVSCAARSPAACTHRTLVGKLKWAEETVVVKRRPVRVFTSPAIGGSHQTGQTVLSCFSIADEEGLVVDCEVSDRSERGEYQLGARVVRTIVADARPLIGG